MLRRFKWAVVALALCFAARADAAPPQVEDPKIPAQIISVAPPFDASQLARIKALTLSFLDRAAERNQKAVVVYEFQPDDSRATVTDVYPLAEFLSSETSAAKQTIAFLPRGLSGNAVLAALACDDIVLGEDATLGPIGEDGQPVSPVARTIVETLAKRKGRDAGLLLGMLEPAAELREVQTANAGTRFVLARDLDAFARENRVLNDKPAWEGGTRGVLTAQRARDLQVAAKLADSRNKLVAEYNLDPRKGPMADGPIKPKLIQIQGPIDSVKSQYVERQISQAVNEKYNWIILRLNSPGGTIDPVRSLTELLTKISGQGVHTIAVVDDQAMGMSTLVALACDKIVVKAGTDARLGDVTKIVPAGGAVEPVGPGFVKPLAETAEALARDHMHPEALARAMVDPSIEVVEARDNQSGASVFVTSAQVDANPKKFTIQRVIKPPGKALELDAVSAVELRVADEQTDSLKSWLKSQGLENIPVDQPSWVDQLVLTLNNPAVSGLLLFIGLFMLILELKLPGVGLPAIISALAFLLFFWSHYLGGTADRLEILLFLAGLVAMALELFVFPGFGVFGFTGVLLVLGSVIMASHTFVWPTQDYEYRQLGWTLAQISITIVSVAGSAILLGRFFPSMPLFRRMVLVPQDPSAGDEKPAASFESGESLAYLLGERGRTTTVCRPIGKARFGDILIDVIADGFYYEADTPVEVIEVRGTQVLVKRI